MAKFGNNFKSIFLLVSQSVEDKVEILKNGTCLQKIRDKGTRGVKLYER